MTQKRETPKPRDPVRESDAQARDDDVIRRDDDVIRIEDLAPSGNVTGGRKILLGEMLTPASTSRIQPGS